MHGYTIPMALFDYLPVLLSGFGLWQIRAYLIARNAALTGLLTLGWLAVISGGLCKATWKLIYAASANDIEALDAMLFLGLTPGFIILCRGWFATRSDASATTHFSFAVSVILFTSALAFMLTSAYPDSRMWFFVLLALTTIFNSVLLISLAMTAWRRQLRFASLLFIVNLTMAFILSGLGRIEEQTAALQWIEESLNFIAQGGFAWAAWQLRHATAARPA